MSQKTFLKFLGTAGARFVVAKQFRASAGILISRRGCNILLDPGPGALVRCAESKPPIDPESLAAVVLSHSHIDHSNDVNVIIDAMTAGGLRRQGVLFAPAECLKGDNAVVLKYLKGFLEKIEIVEADGEYVLGDIVFRSSKRHQHPAETYGFLFDFDGRRVSFMTDTKYFPELADIYRGSDVLVMNVVRDRPFEDSWIQHLILDDVRRLLPMVRPKTAILTHFGMQMLKAGPDAIARSLSNETGIEVLAAYDGMTFEIG